jgi:hypothetical protein
MYSKPASTTSSRLSHFSATSIIMHDWQALQQLTSPHILSMERA